MDELKSDKSLSKWLVNNYNRYFRSSANNVDSIISDLRRRGFSDAHIIDLAKADNSPFGLVF